MSRTPPPLPPAVPGDRRDLRGRAGRIGLYAAGPSDAATPPVLLVHSINAAASAYEVRPVYERLSATRRVYAVDLPGFGTADRSDRRYDIRLYTDAVHDALDAIGAETGGRPVDALALSLSAEFLARAAVERPERVRSLALVTPTGFSRMQAARSGPSGSSREIPGIYAAVRFPLWSKGLYDLLVSRRSIRYFLERTWGSKAIDDAMVDYDWASAHQPGARFAPFAFLSGRLFAADVRDLYERLTQPVWMPHGTRGDFRDFSGAGWVVGRPNWTVTPYPTGALVHFEQPDRFVSEYRAFLGRHPA